MSRKYYYILFFILVCSLVVLIALFGKKVPEGEYMPIQEAENLTWLLADTMGIKMEFPGNTEKTETEYLTFYQFQKIYREFDYQNKQMDGMYKKNDLVLKEDWYTFFDEVRERYDQNNKIQELDIKILGIGNNVSDGNGTTLGEEQLLSDLAVFSFRTEYIRKNLFCSVRIIQREGIIYAVKEKNDDRLSVSNVWIMGEKESNCYYFYRGYEIQIPESQMNSSDFIMESEQIADIQFSNGKVSDINWKKEKISGKLLKVTGTEIEVEGHGMFPLSEDFAAYKICGTLRECEKAELRIGYDFTDFVISDGKIQAALISKEENMENIRVLIKNSDYQEQYHDELEIQADCDLTVTAGWGTAVPYSVTWPAGEILKISSESELFDAGKLYLKPAANTGKIKLLNVKRTQENPEYRGNFELERNEQGITVINEVLLEEYLYAVVPSEMPSSYSLEALKAQAVSARTYAYQRMLQAGIPELGAHLDDSSSYQVYNNISEQMETTKAVRETKGELLCYGNELAQTYYYSTSCGYGSSAAVWSASDKSGIPYLSSKAVNITGVESEQGDSGEDTEAGDEVKDSVEIQAEDAFSEFIHSVRDTDFESSEAWYRWTYTIREIDCARILECLKVRFQANPSLILTEKSDGTFISEKPEELGQITDIQVISREEGGAVSELEIVGEKVTYLVKTEYNIRTVLNDGKSPVIRMDGSSWFSDTLLPSAFFDLELLVESGTVTGYDLFGGGFGHGVGMSQNGARNMAELGYDYETILGFFYEGSSIKTAY